MSFAGFVFDMIRRDKENRNLRLLRRERLNERLDKMHKGRRMPHNTTAEDMEKISKLAHIRMDFAGIMQTIGIKGRYVGFTYIRPLYGFDLFWRS